MNQTESTLLATTAPGFDSPVVIETFDSSGGEPSAAVAPCWACCSRPAAAER